MSLSLRNNVNFRALNGGVEIDHSVWQLDISRKLLEKSSAKALFESANAEVEFDPDDALMVLLRGQGCLSVPKKNFYNSDDIFEIFNGVSLDWYREYYEHALWDELRDGKASENTLLTWLIHNYHVSVNAGITHARIGAMVNDPVMSEEHKTCALEEYWHANSFYFVKDGTISVPERDIKDYIPLASSYAFQIHLRYLSEHDPLGYKLVSYFQERTIMFHEGCEDFYTAVETNFGTPGLFDGWRKHISLDIELDHRNKRSDILTSGSTITADDLHYSVNNARRAAQLLSLCLDDIVEFSENHADISLRLPRRDKRSSQTMCDLSETLGFNFDQGSAAFSNCILDIVTHQRRTILQSSEQDWLETAINQSVFTFLGRSRYHDEIMTAGDLARIFKFKSDSGEVSLRLEALRNHLFELANGYRVEFLTTLIVLSSILHRDSQEEVKFEKAMSIALKAVFDLQAERPDVKNIVIKTCLLVLDLLDAKSLSAQAKIVDPNFS